MDFLENGLIFTKILDSKGPKHYLYGRNLTSIILHLLLPVLIAIGNTIEEHIGNICKNKKEKKSIFPTPPNINTSPPPTACSAGSLTTCKFNSYN